MKNKITWVIPMAGKGVRIQSLGEFKPFIRIRGQKMLFWFLFSIKHLIKEGDTLIFITTSYFSKKFNFEKELELLLKRQNISNKFYVVETPSTPRGQSETVLYAKNFINQENPLIVINPDQYVDFDLPEKIEDCYLALYLQLGNKSGFVEIKKGFITNFVEKNNISNLACAGIYIVSRAKLLLKAIEEQIKSKETLNGEYYLGSAFNFIIKNDIKVKAIAVRAKYDLGNVDDVLAFEKNQLVVLNLSTKFK